MAVKDKCATSCPAVDGASASSTTAVVAMEWNAEEEIQLFKALGGLKPIGINKHFFMACICDRLSAALKRDISADVVWAHLHTMYNLEMLDSMEPLPFPQDERDFALPDDADFAALIAKKLAAVAAVAAAGRAESTTSTADGGATATAANSGASSNGRQQVVTGGSGAAAGAADVVDAQPPSRASRDRSGTASPMVKCECYLFRSFSSFYSVQ